MAYVSLFALLVCVVALYIAIKIYRETPKIDKELEKKLKEKNHRHY